MNNWPLVAMVSFSGMLPEENKSVPVTVFVPRNVAPSIVRFVIAPKF
jgi:hypothetical protein